MSINMTFLFELLVSETMDNMLRLFELFLLSVHILGLHKLAGKNQGQAGSH